MSDFDETQAQTRRGRRDPELAMQLQAQTPDAMQDYGGHDEDADFIGLVAGDSVMAKVTIAGQTPLGDGWFTYAATSHVLNGETEEDAYMRVGDVVNTRVIDLANDAVERLNEITQQAQQGRRRGPGL